MYDIEEKPLPPIQRGDAVRVQVFKRDAEYAIAAWGTVISIDQIGVQIEDSHSTRTLYPWHVVLEVQSKL